MEKTLPIYKLVIKDDDENMGVNYVALVDEPAIQRNFFAFNAMDMAIAPKPDESKDDFLSRCIPHEINKGHEQDQAVAMCSSMYDNHNSMRKINFAADKERRIITGALMIADMPIYRRNEKMGEFYVVFDKFQIEKIAQRFMKNGYNDNVNKMHDAQQTVEGVYMYESFITDSQRGILAPRGFESTPEGTWFGSYKVDNDEVWNEFIKTGEFKGFSVEGTFDLVPERTALESEIIDIINQIK